MISVHFQGKLFNILIIQTYNPNTNVEEGEVEQFYEDLHGLLELTSKKMSFASQRTGMQRQEIKSQLE